MQQIHASICLISTRESASARSWFLRQRKVEVGVLSISSRGYFWEAWTTFLINGSFLKVFLGPREVEDILFKCTKQCTELPPSSPTLPVQQTHKIVVDVDNASGKYALHPVFFFFIFLLMKGQKALLPSQAVGLLIGAPQTIIRRPLAQILGHAGCSCGCLGEYHLWTILYRLHVCNFHTGILGSVIAYSSIFLTDLPGSSGFFIFQNLFPLFI